MSDIKCVRCGEPWDSYGVRHGDMLPWEAELFRQGAGCPCCEGVSNGWEPTGISDIENGDGDPIERLQAYEAPPKKWERPEDPKHWECDGCGVQVRTDLDTNELVYRCPWGSIARYNAYEFERRGTPEKAPAHTFDGGFAVCEFCLDSCEKCGAALSHRVERDCYDDGYVWTLPSDSMRERCYCADCYSEAEQEEADQIWRECYSPAERVEYIRKNRSEFSDRCDPKWTEPVEAWRNLLACVRGKVFWGYASELVNR